MTRERWQDSEKVEAARDRVWDVAFNQSGGFDSALDALCSAVAEAVSVPPEAEREGGPCHACGQSAVLVKERRTMQWGGARGERPFFHEADAEFWRCEACGEEWCTAQQSRRVVDSQLLPAITKEWRTLADAAASQGEAERGPVAIREMSEHLTRIRRGNLAVFCDRLHALIAAARSAGEGTPDCLTPLARLGAWVLAEMREHSADIDGGDVQDKAEAFGVVAPEPAQKPCCENCACAEYDSDICYRNTKATNDALALLEGAQHTQPEKR